MIRSALPCALALASLGALAACSGTETDNPVVGSGGYDSPNDFGSPSDSGSPGPDEPPGVPVGGEDALVPPLGLARAATLDLAEGHTVLVRGDYRGLELLDVSDPAHVTFVSRVGVQGAVHQLLRAAPTELWVASTDPPTLNQTTLPAASELQDRLQVFRLDVSNPAAPARLAGVTLEGDFWQMQERAGDLWVLTGRRIAAERGCAAVQNPFENTLYEAVELHGFHANGGALEPIGDAELPVARHVWWSMDGVATTSEDGSLHILAWDGTGRLRAPIQLPASADQDWSGPLEIAGSTLLAVGYGAGQARLYGFDLASGVAQPGESFDLGAHPESPGVFSLLADGRLWLNPPYSSAAAELWDVSGATPARLTLPGAYSRVLPLADATLAGQAADSLALGWRLEPAQQAAMLSLQGSNVQVVGGVSETPLSATLAATAPEGLRGNGSAPSWELKIRGAGLPLGVDPAAPPDYVLAPHVEALVGVSSANGATLAEAALLDSYLPGAAVQPNPRLEIRSSSGATTSFELPPGSDSLLAVPGGVLVLALEEVQGCLQTGRDCSNYTPGVTLFDAASTPRQVASLPLPEIPIGAAWDPSRMSLSWDSYDPVMQTERIAQPLGPEHFAFVADVRLSCDNQPACDALGLVPVPIAEAGVLIATPAPCVGNGCMDQPYQPPTIYGQAHRQYVYALQIAGPDAPRWQALGVSELESYSGDSQNASRFAAPLAFGNTLAVTRLERFRAGQLLPAQRSRFMLDRFALNAGGEPEQLPPVNVPGYPVARLGADDRAEYWISAEPLPGALDRARLHRLGISTAGAQIEQTLELDGNFAGFWPIQSGDSSFGLVLANPENACGSTRLSAIALGPAEAASSTALQVTSVLELPSDDWHLVAIDGARAALQHAAVYALVELDAAGQLHVSSVQGTATYAENEQLLGHTLRGASSYGPLKLDF